MANERRVQEDKVAFQWVCLGLASLMQDPKALSKQLDELKLEGALNEVRHGETILDAAIGGSNQSFNPHLTTVLLNAGADPLANNASAYIRAMRQESEIFKRLVAHLIIKKNRFVEIISDERIPLSSQQSIQAGYPLTQAIEHYYSFLRTNDKSCFRPMLNCLRESATLQQQVIRGVIRVSFIHKTFLDVFCQHVADQRPAVIPEVNVKKDYCKLTESGQELVSALMVLHRRVGNPLNQLPRDILYKILNEATTESAEKRLPSLADFCKTFVQHVLKNGPETDEAFLIAQGVPALSEVVQAAGKKGCRIS